MNGKQAKLARTAANREARRRGLWKQGEASIYSKWWRKIIAKLFPKVRKRYMDAVGRWYKANVKAWTRQAFLATKDKDRAEYERVRRKINARGEQMIALPWWALWLLASGTCILGWILCAMMSKVESPLYNNDLDESHARVRYNQGAHEAHEAHEAHVKAAQYIVAHDGACFGVQCRWCPFVNDECLGEEIKAKAEKWLKDRHIEATA